MIRSILTPLGLQRGARFAFAAGLAGVTVAMLGPFAGAEATLGLSGTVAHGAAFYGLTVGLFLSAPRMRRLDLALVVLGFGLLIEIAQGVVGRTPSLSGFAADIAGVFAACLPGMVERLRHHVRTSPHATFAQIAAADPRQQSSGSGLTVPRRVVRYVRLRPSAVGNRRPLGRR